MAFRSSLHGDGMEIPFLSGADGVVRNFKQNSEATRLFTNHPRPLRGLPSFERRGMNSLQQLSSISKLLASGNHQKSDVSGDSSRFPQQIDRNTGSEDG